ncbi:hypothetical protein [Acetatifactor muris]|nr:hypothetical protein [Acetatifactor muris]
MSTKITVIKAVPRILVRKIILTAKTHTRMNIGLSMWKSLNL